MSSDPTAEIKLSKAQQRRAAALFARVNGAIWPCPDCADGVYLRLAGVTLHHRVADGSLRREGGEGCIPF
jgi:hypothetical protein